MNVLIVEDEPAIREFEATYLKDAGYGVVETGDGRTAIEAFGKSKIDLAVVDINLPRVNGFDVCRSIREVSAIPILIVTARGSDEDELKGLALGADDYIKKPFNPNILVARVEALLRRHATNELHFKGMTINPETMIVKMGDRRISLTTTRFNLLLALAARPGVVLTRGQLVDTIYSDPAGHFIYERTIDAHIKALRQHIETDPKHPRYIETVIGSGYRFVGEKE